MSRGSSRRRVVRWPSPSFACSTRTRTVLLSGCLTLLFQLLAFCLRIDTNIADAFQFRSQLHGPPASVSSSVRFTLASSQSRSQLLASTLDKSTSSASASITTTSKQKHRSNSSSSSTKESARLAKAKLLLEQFQSDTVTVDDVITASAVNSNNNILVPDNYWSNGHLEDNQSPIAQRMS